MTQDLTAELVQVTVPTVNERLKGIYVERELPSEATIRKLRIVRFAGTRKSLALMTDALHGNRV